MAYVITNTARFNPDKLNYLPLTECNTKIREIIRINFFKNYFLAIRGAQITLQLFDKEKHERGVWEMCEYIDI